MAHAKGLFFVFEGIDGSGKSAQAKLLAERFAQEGWDVETLDFPQYGKKSAGPVEEYLGGKYGGAQAVGPHATSVFYAIDRFDVSFQLQEWLVQGKVVVSDRYVGSNMGHQGAKIGDEQKREEFFRWLYQLEYGIFGIPKPTMSFFLHVPSAVAAKLAEDPERRKTKKKDIHEADSAYLQAAERAYAHAAKLFPEDFITIECAPQGAMRSPQDIAEEVWTNVKKFL